MGGHLLVGSLASLVALTLGAIVVAVNRRSPRGRSEDTSVLLMFGLMSAMPFLLFGPTWVIAKIPGVQWVAFWISFFVGFVWSLAVPGFSLLTIALWVLWTIETRAGRPRSRKQWVAAVTGLSLALVSPPLMFLQLW